MIIVRMNDFTFFPTKKECIIDETIIIKMTPRNVESDSWRNNGYE